MSIKKISEIQPETFEFSKDNLHEAEEEIKKYPKGKKESAVLALLRLAQKQNDNWIPLAAIKYIAKLLSVPYIQIYEVATFYSMLNLSPVGKYFVQVCTTTPCMLKGSAKIVDVCKRYISKNQNELSENKLCSWTEVECLGACVNAPIMQINQDYFEDLDENKTEKIIHTLLEDKLPTPGSAKNRKNTAPKKGKTTLLEIKNAYGQR
jgi:NADH-quinone oxidoreductase subunit E